MNKEVENKHALSEAEGLVPELRFPEFLGKKTWADRRLSDVLFEHGTKSEGDEEVFSVSVHKGVINQIEHLGRRFAAATTDHYSRVLPGDVIYTKSPTGDFPFGVIKQSKVSKPVIVSPLYGVFKPETYAMGVILDAYFEYPERTINYLASIIQKGAKNTINIKNDTFLSKSLILPTDPDEQQKIASCLSSLDELITAESDRLETLKAHKKGLMQQLFPAEGETVPKLRFKEFEGSGEWEKKIVSNLGKFTGGGTPSKSVDSYWQGQIPWISSSDISEDSIRDIQITRFISEEGLENSATKIVPVQSLLLVARVGVGKIAITNQELCTSQDFINITPDEDNLTFLAYCFKSNSDKLLAFSQGMAIKGFTKEDVSKLNILLPPDKENNEQQKIATCLSSLDELISAQTAKIDGLKAHKKGLMQGLFPRMN